MFTSARQKISSREHDKKCRRKYTNIKTFRFKNRMEEEGNECVMGGYGIELEFSSRAAFLFPKYFLILCTLLHVLFCKTAFVLNHSKKKSNKQKHIELLRKKNRFILRFAFDSFIPLPSDSIEMFASFTLLMQIRRE